MNIGKRLEVIGELVPQGAVLADIGTDHAYLPVWLIKKGKITKAIAGDIAKGPCKAAKCNIALYGLKDAIEVRLGSGLEVINAGEADAVAIAGMGASTIIDILNAEPEKTKSIKTLVLQPMIGGALLRKWAAQNGWRIAKEELVEDGERLYEIMALEQGEGEACSDAVNEIGPRLLDSNHPLLAKKFDYTINHYQNLLKQMQKSSEMPNTQKYKDTEKLVHDLEALKNGSNGR